MKPLLCVVNLNKAKFWLDLRSYRFFSVKSIPVKVMGLEYWGLIPGISREVDEKFAFLSCY
jgi:hypothetical protein